MLKYFCLNVMALLAVPLCLYSQALPIKKEGKWGAINPNGELLIDPQYDFLSDFNTNGWASYGQNGKSGVINKEGKVIVPAEYQQVRPISDRFIAIWKDGRCGLVDANNQELIAPAFDNIDTLTHALLRVRLEGKYGISNDKGEAILAATHEKMGKFEGGSSVALLAKEGKSGLMFLSSDRKEVTVYEPIYDQVKETQEGNFLAYKDSKITLITVDANGSIAGEQTFNNEVAYKLAMAGVRKKRLMESQTSPKKPRWVKNGFQYQLADGLGTKLLGGMSFFNLSVDKDQGIAMGVRENEQKEEECYIIQMDQAKVLLTLKAKDLIITDFRNSEYARLTLDTLYDGLVNKSGKVISKLDGQEITNIGNFNDGLASVLVNGQYGFVNTQGELSIPLAFDIVSDFNNGYAIARKEGKFGCIDTSGAVAIPFMYDGIDTPKQGVLRAKKGRGSQGRWGMINLKNETIAPFNYTIIGAVENGEAIARQGKKLGVINIKGEVVVPITLTVDFLGSFNHGVAQVGMERMVENIAGRPEIRYKYQGYVNREGVMIVPPSYSFIYDFDSIYQAGFGVAKVIVDGRVGYINHAGKVVVKAEYDAIEGFEEIYQNQEGLAKIRKGNKFGYINATGKKVLEPAYSSVDGFDVILADTNRLAMASIDGKYGYINYKEKPVVPLVYEGVSPVLDHAVVVQAAGKQGVVSLTQDTLIPIEYKAIRPLQNSDSKLLLLYKQQNTQLTFDSSGNVVDRQVVYNPKAEALVGVKDSKYKYLTDFDQYGLAVIQDSKGKKGLITIKGKVVCKPDYQAIGVFSEGLAPFKVDHKDRSKQLWGYLNTSGEEVVAPRFRSAGAFGSERGLVLDGRQWGYIDRTGKLVIPSSYRQAEPFSGGYAVVNQSQIIDVNGQVKGSFSMDNGSIIQGFSSERAITEVPSGQLHIRANGKPAYYATYDEVTPYLGSIAFVKKGEVWNLIRKVNDREVAIPFSKAGMRKYKSEYGNRDKKTTKEGVDIKDVKWELSNPGVWRMIDDQGYFVGNQIYQEVQINTEEQTFTAQIPAVVGLAKANGEVLLTADHEQIKVTDTGLVQVVSFGKIGYMKPDGSWVWELQ